MTDGMTPFRAIVRPAKKRDSQGDQKPGVQAPSAAPGGSSNPAVVPERVKTPDDVEFDFNPETLSLTYEHRPASSGSRGKGAVQSTGEVHVSLSFDAIFDNTHGSNAGEDVRKRTRIFATALDHERNEEGKSKQKQAVAPASLEFVWGTFYFKGIVKSVRETLDFFLANGTPVRSRLAVTMEAVRDDLRILPPEDDTKSPPGASGRESPAADVARAAGSPVAMTDREARDVFGPAAAARAGELPGASKSAPAPPTGNPWSPDGPALGSRAAALAQAVNASPLPTPSALMAASTSLGLSTSATAGVRSMGASLSTSASLSVGASLTASASLGATSQAPLPVLGSPPRVLAEIGAPPAPAVFGTATVRKTFTVAGRPRWEGAAAVEISPVAEANLSLSGRTSW